MKIVVIGGTGLIGSKTVAILRQGGHAVVAASPKSGVNSITGEGLKEAMAGALQLTEPVLDVVEVDHRDALETGGIGAAAPDGRPAGVPGVGEPVVVGAKDCRHQQRVRHFK